MSVKTLFQTESVETGLVPLKFTLTLDLKKKKEPVQRATILHCFGPAVQRIFNTLSGEHKTLEGVKTALDG